MSAMHPYPVTEKSLDQFLAELADRNDPRRLEDKNEDWLEYMDHVEYSLSNPAELAEAKAKMCDALTPMIEEFITRPAEDGSKLGDLKKAYNLVDVQYCTSTGDARVQAHARMTNVVKAAYLLGTPQSQRLSKDAFDWQVDEFPLKSDAQQGFKIIGNQVFGHPDGDLDRIENAGYHGADATDYRHPAHVMDRMKQFLASSDLVVGKQGLLVARGDAPKP